MTHQLIGCLPGQMELTTHRLGRKHKKIYAVCYLKNDRERT
jgi:hypothetical protein